MKEQIKIHTIAFEGEHRSGKGTQIELLKENLDRLNIPYIMVRGAGSRPNKNEHKGDKYSEWWEEHLKVLRSSGVSKNDWSNGSKRLARELIVFRDRFLPQLALEKNSARAILLIDRSILSHLIMFDLNKISDQDVKNIYGDRDSKNRKMPPIDAIIPDIIFYLKTNTDTLLLRLELEKTDPKYEFRKKNIIENEGVFDHAINILPKYIKDAVVTIDGSKTPKQISEEIFALVNKKIT